ncbi:conserved hypothetical protein [gamma proteobacterium HdN1]|nr:conserved hypothetical protein [gamma proteobacterium HdN1]
MTEFDYRNDQLNPTHTITECRAIQPGHYQVTGVGERPEKGDRLLVSLRNGRDLHLTLDVESSRSLINPPGHWTLIAHGPAFRELMVHSWKVRCDHCDTELDFDFAVDASLGASAQIPAAQARIAELGWQVQENHHLCPQCQS